MIILYNPKEILALIALKNQMVDSITSNIPRADVLKFAARIEKNFKEFIMQATRLTGTPYNVVLSTAVKELQNSPFNAVSSAGAIGIMQLKPVALSETLFKAKRYGFVSVETVAFLRRKLGSDFAFLYAQNQSYSGARWRKYLFDPEFNIFFGALMLRVLMHEHTESNGIVNFAKVFVAYNQGYYVLSKNYKSGLKNPFFEGAKADTLHTVVPAEAKKFLADTLGKNGIVSVINQRVN